MTDDEKRKEHDKELAKFVKDKIEELTFAHYQGDIKSIFILCLNKDGQLQSMRAYDSIAAPHIYVALALEQRKIEEMIAKNASELKPRE